MNAEALIGTVLGTCMLQKLIGQGGMGAVFLAQQSRPRRQVAVKVLLPVSSQSPNQQAAFLERFRRETDAAASLEHPNIVPVHEYGERDGLAYLVMPYISGGTLRDEMESEQPFPLTKALTYLEQIAAALDFAHEHGVIHRDVKPANILMTPDRRLLLTDFGLVKVVAGNQGQSPNARLTAVGVPMGTPDYMAPEQVIGTEVDSRADLYLLGIILFQMVTGKTPFRGEMPMQIAMQHLHTVPPSPRQFRPDLSPGIEQVMLRAIAKQPQERYTRGGEFAQAFRQALVTAGVLPGEAQHGLSTSGNANDVPVFTRRSLFDPMWQAGSLPRGSAPASINGLLGQNPPVSPTRQGVEQGHRNDIVAKTSMTMPSFSGFFDTPTRAVPQMTNMSVADVQDKQMTPLPDSVLPTDSRPVDQGLPASPFSGNASPGGPTSLHGLRFGRKSLLRPVEDAAASSTQGQGVQSASNSNEQVQSSVEAPQPLHPKTLAGLSGNFAPGSVAQLSFSATSGIKNDANEDSSSKSQSSPLESGAPRPGEISLSPALTRGLNPTGNLGPGAYDGQSMTGMIKLTQPMKVVKVPVAGKPGTFMTGLLPMSPEMQAAPSSLSLSERLQSLPKNMQKLVLLALVAVVLLGTGTFWFVTSRSSSSHTSSNATTAVAPAQATANASATAQANNIILEDSLSTNIHSWKESSGSDQTYIFKDGKYHISVNNGDGAALADLPEEIMPDSFVFSVDASEIKGDDTSVNNQFGLVFRLNQAQKDGQPWVTFYCFQVQNTQGNLQYQFRKYDSSYMDDAEKWSTPWSANAGKEYHFGHGSSATNTIKVVVKNGNFAFVVNGKTVGSFKDTSFRAGRIGLLVN